MKESIEKNYHKFAEVDRRPLANKTFLSLNLLGHTTAAYLIVISGSLNNLYRTYANPEVILPSAAMMTLGTALYARAISKSRQLSKIAQDIAGEEGREPDKFETQRTRVVLDCSRLLSPYTYYQDFKQNALLAVEIADQSARRFNRNRKPMIAEGQSIASYIKEEHEDEVIGIMESAKALALSSWNNYQNMLNEQEEATIYALKTLTPEKEPREETLN